MTSGSGLLHLNYKVTQIIDPNPINYKVTNSFNSSRPNISKYILLSQKLALSGSSQYVSLIGRSGWRTQYGNFYLGKSLNLNYLGKMEGMPGGSGKPPLNQF
jgi:hypothetical protein